jgi:tetratricopeptide (TPR) repeat protein
MTDRTIRRLFPVPWRIFWGDNAMPEPPFEVSQAHRWFAVELNNRAWDLVEATERSPDETDEMIDSAHAACLHWRTVGVPLNALRSECQLSTAYALAGLAESAVHHAEKCLRLTGQLGGDQTAFDLASVHGCAANAYACAGDAKSAMEYFRRSTEYAAEIVDANERQLLELLYPAPTSN